MLAIKKLFAVASAANPKEAGLARAAFVFLLLFPISMLFKRWGGEVCCAMIALIFLYRSWQMNDWHWLGQWPVKIALCLWVYSLLIVTPLAQDPYASLMRVGWLRFVIMFAAVVYWLSDYAEEVRKVALATLIFLVAVALDTLIQYKTGFSLTGNMRDGNRLTGPFAKVIVGIFLAKMSFPCVGILCFYAVKNRQWKWLALLGTALLFIFSMIILSNERTATATFFIGISLAGAIIFLTQKKLRLYIAIFVVLQIGVITSLFLTQTSLHDRTQATKRVISNYWESPYGQLWQASYLIWKAHPITGAGMMNFREQCLVLKEKILITYCDLHSHNVYLEWLSELGIFGFLGIVIFVISLVILTLRQTLPAHKDGGIMCAFALASLVVTFFPLAATQSFFSNWPALLAWQSIAFALAGARSIGRVSHGGKHG